MSEKVRVEIPVTYLLIIACYGNMGDGELPDLMRNWAERKCKELGHAEDLRKMKEEKILTLKTRLTNVLGEKLVGKLEEEIGMAVSLIKKDLQ